MTTQGHFQVYLPILAAFPLFLGALGLLWSTFGAPGLALFFTATPRLGATPGASPTSASTVKPLRIEIVVAAYNEERMIRSTLESLETAARNLKAAYGEVFALRMTVGLDHCNDGTAKVVAEMAQVSEFSLRAVENLGERGKWNTLMMLVGKTDADWVGLVDCGSIWDSQLLVAAWPSIQDQTVMGVAPSYAPRKSGLMESATWRLERFLKKTENRVGGPVSVHGATVLYRRFTLLGALSTLHGQAWLNDDVVVPLVLRLQNPGSRIVYLADGIQGAWVTDLGVASELKVEYGRRRRMVVGNLQWIRLILLPQLSVALVASRRVFRVFWAYWILLIMVGTGAEIALALRDISGSGEIARAFLLELGILAGTICTVGGFLFSNWARRLGVAFINGLFISRYWKELSTERGVSWV